MLGISGNDAQNSMFLKIKLWGGILVHRKLRSVILERAC